MSEMNDYIVRDGDRDVVGKYRQHEEPDVPSRLSVEQVSNLSHYSVSEWWDRCRPT